MSTVRSERFSISLAPAVLAQLDAFAKEHRWSRSNAAAELIERGLEGGNIAVQLAPPEITEDPSAFDQFMLAWIRKNINLKKGSFHG